MALLFVRKVAKELCYDFNQLRPSDEEGQQGLLSRLLGKVGKNTCSIAPFTFATHRHALWRWWCGDVLFYATVLE